MLAAQLAIHSWRSSSWDLRPVNKEWYTTHCIYRLLSSPIFERSETARSRTSLPSQWHIRAGSTRNTGSDLWCCKRGFRSRTSRYSWVRWQLCTDKGCTGLWRQGYGRNLIRSPRQQTWCTTSKGNLERYRKQYYPLLELDHRLTPVPMVIIYSICRNHDETKSRHICNDFLDHGKYAGPEYSKRYANGAKETDCPCPCQPCRERHQNVRHITCSGVLLCLVQATVVVSGVHRWRIRSAGAVLQESSTECRAVWPSSSTQISAFSVPRPFSRTATTSAGGFFLQISRRGNSHPYFEQISFVASRSKMLSIVGESMWRVNRDQFMALLSLAVFASKQKLHNPSMKFSFSIPMSIVMTSS